MRPPRDTARVRARPLQRPHLDGAEERGGVELGWWQAGCTRGTGVLLTAAKPRARAGRASPPLSPGRRRQSTSQPVTRVRSPAGRGEGRAPASLGVGARRQSRRGKDRRARPQTPTLCGYGRPRHAPLLPGLGLQHAAGTVAAPGPGGSRPPPALRRRAGWRGPGCGDCRAEPRAQLRLGLLQDPPALGDHGSPAPRAREVRARPGPDPALPETAAPALPRPSRGGILRAPG